MAPSYRLAVRSQCARTSGRAPDFRGTLPDALVQTRFPVSDDGLMPAFVPVEELFKGRHFDHRS